jgi:hypothetical protein
MQTRLWWRLWWGSDRFRGLESGGQFCVGAIGRDLASVAVKTLYVNIVYKYIFIHIKLSMRFANMMIISMQ